MTDRDTFAAAALTGLLANEGEGPSLSNTCGYAYRIADAMLRERGTAVSDNRVTGNQREMEYPQHSLTDEERDALEFAVETGKVATHDAATLRNLLDRFR